MFKKRNIEKKQMTDVMEDIKAINVQSQHKDEVITVPKAMQSKKINKFTNKNGKEQAEEQEQKKKPIVRYGLIDKSQVNSKYHANQQGQGQEKPKESNSLVNYYIKKKMQELNSQVNQTNDDQEKKNTATQIREMQKKYLETSEQKLAEYNIEEIQRKLEKMAGQAIKNQLQNRSKYLKELLENEYEKMEYATKKELKVLKQGKERLEKQYQSKYNDSGRRSYVEKMKYEAMMHK